MNAHCVSPEGRVEERGGIDEDELLVLTKCLITFQNFLLSLFSKSVIINLSCYRKILWHVFFDCLLYYEDVYI